MHDDHLGDFSEGRPQACDVVSQKALVALQHWDLLWLCMPTHLTYFHLCEIILIKVISHPEVCAVPYAERVTINSDRGQKLAQMLLR